MTVAQRLRFTFARGEAAKYVSHLDLARLWERALRRARLPVAYSSGFTPRARIAFAAPLSVGHTAGAEPVDVYLSESVAPEEALARLRAQLPEGLTLLSATAVDPGAPSLQAQVRAAEYVVSFAEDVPELSERVAALLARSEVPCERRREGKRLKALDLRPLIQALSVAPAIGATRLTMLLKMDTAGAARPDEVLAALGLADRRLKIHRERLLLVATAGVSPGSESGALRS